jgi:hypothetical protein
MISTCTTDGRQVRTHADFSITVEHGPEALRTGSSSPRPRIPPAVTREEAFALVGDGGGDQVVLGGEVGVEGAVGQPGVGHERGDPGAVDAVALEPAAGRLDDPQPGRLLVLFPYRTARSFSRREDPCALPASHFSTIII